MRNYMDVANLKQTNAYFQISYKCPGCQISHNVKINRKIIEGADSYPVSYLHIHGDPKIFTTLYIDASFRIRGAEVLQSVSVNEFDDILNNSTNRTLKTIPKEKIYAFQLMEENQILKLYFQENLEGNFDFNELSKLLINSGRFIKEEDGETCDEIYLRYPDYWIVTLQMFYRTLIMVIDSSIDIDRLKTQTMAIFEVLE